MSEQKPFIYQTRRPEETLLYKTILSTLNTFLLNLQNEGRSLPCYVIKELYAYLECGVLAYGFVRIKCEDWIRKVRRIFLQKTRILPILWCKKNGRDCSLSGG